MFRISVDASRGLITLVGDLDREHSPQLAAALSTLAGTSHEFWLVDAAGVTFCDVSGLRALAAGAAVAREHGRRLSITASSRCVQRLLTLANLGHLLRPPGSAGLPRAHPDPRSGRRPVPPRRGDRVGPRRTVLADEPAEDCPSLVIDIDHHQGSLQLTGQLDRWNVHLLKDAVSALLLSDRDRWTADMTALAVVDHAGLKAIGNAYRRLLRHRRRLALRGASRELVLALTRLRLDHHLLDDIGQRPAGSPRSADPGARWGHDLEGASPAAPAPPGEDGRP